MTSEGDTVDRTATRFMIDHMLVKLGKYLRIAGYDAAWDASLRTHELITRANDENRIFLSRNQHLHYAYPRIENLYHVASLYPVAQLHEVTVHFHLSLHEHLFSRCIRCNEALLAIGEKGTIRSRVHPSVFAAYERFYTCPSCGTVFWRGSHVRNTCRKLGIAPQPDGEPPAPPQSQNVSTCPSSSDG